MNQDLRDRIVVGRATWAWWGVAAGVLGVVATTGIDPQGDLSVADRSRGPEVVELLERGRYHLSALLGILAVGCLVVAGAGWRRWADQTAGDSLAARTVGTALVASAGALIIGQGFKGTMAIYLPGGINDQEVTVEFLHTLYVINDLAAYFAWWGVAVAAIAVAWLALGEKVLPRWMGVISILAVLPPLGFLFGAGFTGLAGVPSPVWLAVVSVGMVFRRQPATT